MNDTEYDLLRSQLLECASNDARWCQECGFEAQAAALSGVTPHRSVLATVRYTVAHPDDSRFTMDINACRDHFTRAIRERSDIVSSEPIEQPPYVALLWRLFGVELEPRRRSAIYADETRQKIVGYQIN